jgi:hypothetical protein
MHIGFELESQKKRRALGRPRRGWEDNIKRDLRKIGWAGIVWIDLTQNRDQWRAPLNTGSMKCWEIQSS